MWGHLVIFAKILSSNQVLWDSFSPLEKNVECDYMQSSIDSTDYNYTFKKNNKKWDNTFFLSVVRIVALSWSCSQKKNDKLNHGNLINSLIWEKTKRANIE